MSVSAAPTGRMAAALRRGRGLPVRAPERAWEVAGFLLALLAVSASLRTRAIGAPLWADEGISQGIASHSLGGVLGALRQDGAPPLYYLLLHGWMRAFGTEEPSLHALSLLFALACVPAAMWAAWTLFGRAAGLAAATLAAVNPYLSAYGQEARMYTLLSLLALVAAAAFVLAFVRRDRRAVVAFGAALALMAYTHNWGLFFGAAAAVCVVLLARRAPDRSVLLRDAALAFGGAAVLYLPWLPTLIGQALETGAPWARPPSPTAPVHVLLVVFGGAAAGVILLAGTGAGLPALLRGPHRRPAVVLLGLAAGTLTLAWLASQISPAWSPRYFGAVAGALLIVAAAASVRGGALGLAALVATVVLWLPQPSATVLTNKANADVLAAELSARLRPGDLVLSMQPEQVPVLRYYLPPGLRYADPRGMVADPRVMDWRRALEDLRRIEPAPALAAVLAGVPRGGRILFVAPVTEHRRDWRAPWTELVRRRAAQWGAMLEARPALRQIAVAPRFYRESLTVGMYAVLYRRS